MVSRGSEREGDGLGVWGCRHKLLQSECVSNKVLMHSTGNYIQHPVINHNKKILKSVYMCINESFCYTADIGTTL